jgi:hypothetical protein
MLGAHSVNNVAQISFLSQRERHLILTSVIADIWLSDIVTLGSAHLWILEGVLQVKGTRVL